jgi:CDP-glucose 4,6-dehydratase
MDKNFWYGKRVFITGHTGFKGSWLCELLLARGASITGYALAPNTEPNLWSVCGLETKLESHIGDVRDIDKLQSVFSAAQPEMVFHLAAQPLVFDGYNEPRYTYETNVMGTVNLLECIRNANCVRSFVNVTTDKVYLNRESGEDYREGDYLNGYDPYSNSKSCSELVTSSYVNAFLREKQIAVSTARSGNIIGGGDFADNRIIPDCAKAATAGIPIGIRNPESSRPYLFVLDTLCAYLLIAEKQYTDTKLSGAYNIGPDSAVSNGRLAGILCDAWGCGARWERISVEQPHEAKQLGLNCEKIKSLLNWKPRYDIAEAVKLTAEWYKLFYSGGDANSVMKRQIEGYPE